MDFIQKLPLSATISKPFEFPLEPYVKFLVVTNYFLLNTLYFKDPLDEKASLNANFKNEERKTAGN